MWGMSFKMQEKLADLSRRIDVAERLVARYEDEYEIPGHSQRVESTELLEARRRLVSLYKSQKIVSSYLEREA